MRWLSLFQVECQENREFSGRFEKMGFDRKRSKAAIHLLSVK